MLRTLVVLLGKEKAFITALANLGASEPPSAGTMAAIEKLICKLYVPNTTITTVKDLRWWLFKKKQAQSEKLPPTQAALEQTVMRANYQAMVWNNDIVPLPHYHHQITFWLDVAGQQMASCGDYFAASS